jgi:translation initiation factor IF-3
MIYNEIKSNVVNVVLEEGKGLKQMSLEEAMALAEETGEDVVCLNDNTEIPVVKIMDYGKFQYEKAKKAKDNKKKARLAAQDTKDVVISDSIAEHDLKMKEIR